MPVELSIVIVTYRCLPFTELCLQSLLWQSDSRMEIIVVDNNSSDGSTNFIKKNYPSVIIIDNQKNLGFGSACNQGISIAKGRYLLMLNPDTLVPENLTQQILDFMHSHPDCGAMGVKMLDGMGTFLPESKRGIPTLFRSFCRFAGLSRLFPRSAFFSGYYLGHLPCDKPNEVEILSGAFMVLDSEVIKQTGIFNESFFMYGEDIDLSYRILLAGYKIMYNPAIIILHFKGESTIKNNQYAKSFFGSMNIFYNLHFRKNKNRFCSLLVKASTNMLATLSIIKNKSQFLFNKLLKPSKLKGDWVWISNNLENKELYVTQNNLSSYFSGKDMGHITTEGVLTRLNKSVYCILSLSYLSPMEALTNLKILSKKGNKCIWIDNRNRWIFMGWSASEQTSVKPLKTN